MPGPGGGLNSGGFGGGSYSNNYTDGVIDVPEFNFDSIINLYARIQNAFSEFWFSLHKPFFSAFSDLITNDSSGFLSKAFNAFNESFGESYFVKFFNSFSLFDFIFCNLILLFFFFIVKKLKL